MSKAPERIWAYTYEVNEAATGADPEDWQTYKTWVTADPYPIGGAPYIRADLAPDPALFAEAVAVCRIIDDVVREGHETVGEMILHFLTAAEPARALLAKIGGAK